ncbi:caspase family protein [Streptomyces prasinopilosus]|uniref:caspase family protein n=1 Tax=Streptomyces prasinopilosus TaxID=67344 RepID=UPI0006EB6F4E|nr:caspase family protein [Streptomyces prasinopilosus]
MLRTDASAPGDRPAEGGARRITLEDLASGDNLPDTPAGRDGRAYLSAVRGLRAELKEIQDGEPPGSPAPPPDLDRTLLWLHFHGLREHAIRAHIMDDIGPHAIVEDARRLPRESGNLTVDLAEVWLEDSRDSFRAPARPWEISAFRVVLRVLTAWHERSPGGFTVDWEWDGLIGDAAAEALRNDTFRRYDEMRAESAADRLYNEFRSLRIAAWRKCGEGEMNADSLLRRIDDPEISADPEHRDRVRTYLAAGRGWFGPPRRQHERSFLDVVGALCRMADEDPKSVCWPDLVRSAREEEALAKYLPLWHHGAAVLIGVSAYEVLPAVPSIARNIEALRSVMTDCFGVPEANVFVVKDPGSAEDVHEAVLRASEAADPVDGALFVYFAGHGLTDPWGRLMLGLTRSDWKKPWSALDFNNLRHQIADSQIGRRVVVVDSCYSGAALDILGDAESLANAAAIDGTYVLTAANATTPALAPEGEEYTAFTGHLIAALRKGIPGAPEILHTDHLFQHVRRICRERGLPEPGRQVGGDGDRVPLVNNPSWRHT